MAEPLRIDVLTIFPSMFAAFLSESIVKRAREKGLLKVEVHNLRKWAHDVHRSVDDRPFGGGPGMVMKPEPIFEAVEEIKSKIKNQKSKIILLTPQGKKLDQTLARRLARSRTRHWILICGRYEGVDERVRRNLATDEISIGDYITTGGELPAMILIDVVTRFLPHALGDERSADSDSFTENLLEYPQYTRPRNFRGTKVPEVLLSGDHDRIEKWRKKKSLLKTRRRRPDLLGELKKPVSF